MEKHEIAIIGNRDIILGFKGLGVKPFHATTAEEAVTILAELKSETIGDGKTEKPKYAIVFITENLATKISKEDYKKFGGHTLPAIIPVPSGKRSQNYGIQRIGKMVEQAVGSDIFKE